MGEKELINALSGFFLGHFLGPPFFSPVRSELNTLFSKEEIKHQLHPHILTREINLAWVGVQVVTFCLQKLRSISAVLPERNVWVPALQAQIGLHSCRL